jgi:hypothetical protein
VKVITFSWGLSSAIFFSHSLQAPQGYALRKCIINLRQMKRQYAANLEWIHIAAANRKDINER